MTATLDARPAAPLVRRRRLRRSRRLLTAVAVGGLVVLVGAAPPRAAAPVQDGFPATAVPQVRVGDDGAAVELGVTFTVKRAGTIVGIEYFGTSANTGPHTGSLWDSTGTKLAEVTLPDASTDGWVGAELTTPVEVVPGESYVASYHAPRGKYPVSESFFTQPHTSGDIVFPRSAGVYEYGASAPPTSTYRDSNYYVDVKFVADTATPAAPSPTASAAGAPSPAPDALPSNPGARPLRLQREAWWGGPAYYSPFPKAEASGWTSPAFFPIAVFFGKPDHASELRALGINTYMGAEHDGSPISAITGAGVFMLANDEWTPAEVGDDDRVVGWHISDECEMGYSACTADDEYGRLDQQRGYAERARSHDDGRFLQANFGNGVLGTWWGPRTMDEHVGLVDVSSVDKYAYTSPHVQGLLRDTPSWPSGKDPASSSAYGWLQDRMESYSSPVASKPNWVFVEVGRPFLTEEGARMISPDELEGAVWNAIIHGAAGIAYFQHNNDTSCGAYALVDCGPTLSGAVRSVNNDVAALAPVINSQPYSWSFGTGLETSLRSYQGFAYVFAMTDGGSGTRTFRLPPGVDADSVEVVGEDRSISTTGGQFEDTFASESTHHVYRIALD